MLIISHAAGGLGFVIGELISAGLLHRDVKTVVGEGLEHYAQTPYLENEVVAWRKTSAQSGDEEILRPVDNPIAKTGGLALLKGNIGRAVIKVSAVKAEHRIIEAPAIVFQTQQALIDKFKAGELNKDFVAVVAYQGPKAIGMPELHKLTPPLGVLQDKGFKVALVTDGRMSGASGKVPAAIHLTPEAVDGGVIGKIRDGDMVRLDATTGELTVLVDDVDARPSAPRENTDEQWGMGRELFAGMRALVGSAEGGASALSMQEMSE